MSSIGGTYHIKVLDKNHNYSVTENEKGETIIKDEEGNQVNFNQKKEESQESEEETPQTSPDQEQKENRESAEKEFSCFSWLSSDTDEEETEAQRSTGKNENAVSEESQEKQENSAPTSYHTGMLLAVLAGVIFVVGVIFWKKKKQH